MNLLHKINTWLYGITLAMYITVIIGMLLQILLGIVQVMMAIILISRFTEYNSKIKRHLLIYSAITTLYLVFFFGFRSAGLIGFGYEVPLLMILPMSIGGYFVYLTSLVKKWELEERIPFDSEEILD